jgi:hypothetical protein
MRLATGQIDWFPPAALAEPRAKRKLKAAPTTLGLNDAESSHFVVRPCEVAVGKLLSEPTNQDVLSR